MPLSNKSIFLAGFTVAALALISAPAQAYTISSVNLITDNGSWGPPPGYASGSFYDEFSLTVTGTPGEVVSSLDFTFAFDGLFDDSIALDLNRDGVVDYAANYYDLNAAKGGGYAPWAIAADPKNTVTKLSITPTGSTASVSVYGNPVVLTSANKSFNNLGSITLASLGFGPGGTIGASGSVTTTGMRFGYINISGPGGGVPNIQASSIVQATTQSVPEPSNVLGLGLILGVGKLLQRKRDLKLS
ncbi:PEP-CTERM sorting domain-containing protein [Anabaena sp. UHCC 0451]|uniref:PEP-CTERM sorting domain-containing protein n=1 Tax=Anabaena sp. UHCC 0451 TaxID=2055235 RepID=UPI002B21F82C|nr:PEP-CTERM sorting domain-containing protein [Anabaena sp. UHCC 0451]MEA5575621.1 PEP-CTERM sorting domain-containing protein [Anabaena sp. UHCC 0451]